MKRKNLLIAVATLTIPLFSSCGGNTPSTLSNLSTTSSTTSSTASSKTSSSLESSTLSSSSSETLSSSESPKGYYKADLSSYTLNKNPKLDVLYERGMPSTGDVNFYVIPVCFSGADDPQPTEENLEIINKAYFGKAEDTGWESLSSYYYKSSYGKLNIKGTVAPTYVDPRTCRKFENDAYAEDDFTDESSLLIQNAIKAQKEKGFDFSDYDADKDGHLDEVNVVYFTSRPLSTIGVWWAYTSLTGDEPLVESPTPSRYFWSPFSLVETGYYTPNIDTHTLIHETGHALGLKDYYDYSKETTPCGCIDIMDWNLGDHNAYSKMLLGWVNPYVVDGTSSNFSITLNSFTETGDCLILRNTETDPWNGMPYDEYLILQYYTPTGLNEKDSHGNPELNTFGVGSAYKKPGLQVFHVDSRLYSGIQNKDPITGDVISSSFYYTDKIIQQNIENKEENSVELASKIANNNTKAFSINVETGKKGGTSNNLISIIPANGTGGFINSINCYQLGFMNQLFGVGDIYGSDTFIQDDYQDTFPAENEGKFDDGTTIGYSFKVTRNDNSSCDISIYKD